LGNRHTGDACGVDHRHVRCGDVLGYSLDNPSLMGPHWWSDSSWTTPYHVENIARHIEMGKKPMQAALDAGGEIGLRSSI
jgi:hypothetical protein